MGEKPKKFQDANTLEKIVRFSGLRHTVLVPFTTKKNDENLVGLYRFWAT